MASQDIVFKLRFQAKMLEKQAQRENRNAAKERTIARRHLAKGERPLAALHAANSTRATQMSAFYAENAGKVQGMACDVQMAQIQKGMAKTLASTVKQMEQSMGEMDPAHIAAIAVKFDAIRGKTAQAQAIITPTDESVGIGSESLLRDLEMEVEQEQLMDLPVPMAPAESLAAGERRAAPVGE